MVGVAARQGDQRLHEAQPRADDAQQRVRVLRDRDLRPALWWGETKPSLRAIILYVDQIARISFIMARYVHPLPTTLSP